MLAMSLFTVFRRLQPRTEACADGQDRPEPIDQSDLKDRTGVTVILGPAGSGKSVLLGQLAQASGGATDRAALFVADPEPATEGPLFIDGCDEVGLGVNQRPVGVVKQALKELDYPDAVLTCRGVDWSDAVEGAQFRRAYGQSPFVVELLPFSREDALLSLTGQEGVDGPLCEEDARALLRTLDDQNLSEFYTSPLNLEIIAIIVRDQGLSALPSTRSELYAKAGELLCREHRERSRESSPLDQISDRVARDAAGLICLSAVLSGQGLVGRQRGVGGDATPTIPDLEALADPTALRAVQQSRLFQVDATGRLIQPVHKMVGDYLAAQWLIRRANGEPRLIRRIVRSLAPQGLPSADRRALWAWLADDAGFAPHIVEADPVSVLHYGDPDQLMDAHMVALLKSMAMRLREAPGRFFDENSLFSNFPIGRGRPRTRAWLQRVIFDETENRSVRVMALDLIKGCLTTVTECRSQLETCLVDPVGDMAMRIRAASICARSFPEADWEPVVRGLLAEARDDTARMAASFMKSEAVASLPTNLRAEVLLAVAGAQPDQEVSSPNLVAKTYFLLQSIPTGELPDLLSAIRDHDWFDAAIENYPRGRVGHELSRPVVQAIKRLSKASHLTPETLAYWWPVADDGLYRERTLPQLVAFDWACPAFRCDTALASLRPDAASEHTHGARYSWLIDRIDEGQFEPGDIDAIIAALSIGELRALGTINLTALARVAYRAPGTHSGEMLDAAMTGLQGHERWTRSGWADWTSPSEGPEPWEVRRQVRREERERETNEAQRRLRDNLAAPTTRTGVAYNLAKVYMGWTYFQDIPRLETPKAFRSYLGEEGLEHFLEAGEAVLVDPETFSVDALLACEPGRYRCDIQLGMSALWERYRASDDLGALPDRIRETAWLASIFSQYGPFSNLSEMDHRTEFQAALCLSSEATQLSRDRFADMSYGEFNTRMGILEGVVPDKDADAKAFQTGLSWIEGAPGRLPDEFSGLLASLRNAALPVCDIDVGLSELAQMLLETQPELSEKAGRALEAMRFLHDPTHPVPSRADEAFLAAIEHQLNYHFPGARSGLDEESLQPAKGAALFAALRLVVSHDPSLDRFEYRTSGPVQMAGLLNALRQDLTDDAKDALATIDIGTDSWSEPIRDAKARQLEGWSRLQFTPLGPDAIAAMVENAKPSTPDQVHDAAVEALEVLQHRLRSSSEDLAVPFDGILNMAKTQRENKLNALTATLLALPDGTRAHPEILMRGSSRTDIALLTDRHLLPIEAKGQWNPGLYDAAMEQLDQKYASHWQSGGRGIYLVYWFGADQDEKRNTVRRPPGAKAVRPQTPLALKAAIEARLPPEVRSRITVFVLDVTGTS